MGLRGLRWYQFAGDVKTVARLVVYVGVGRTCVGVAQDSLFAGDGIDVGTLAILRVGSTTYEPGIVREVVNLLRSVVREHQSDRYVVSLGRRRRHP